MEYHAEDLARHVRLLHALVVADHASCASHRELRAAASDSDTFDFLVFFLEVVFTLSKAARDCALCVKTQFRQLSFGGDSRASRPVAMSGRCTRPWVLGETVQTLQTG